MLIIWSDFKKLYIKIFFTLGGCKEIYINNFFDLIAGQFHWPGLFDCLITRIIFLVVDTFFVSVKNSNIQQIKADKKKLS